MWKRTWLTAILIGVMAFVPAIQAQEEPEAAEEAVEETSPEEQGAVLDEIVVTAQKREEDPRDVPASLTVLNSDQLELYTTAGADVRFLSGRVPSLLIESSFGRAFPRFYMRGLGNPDFDLNASQPVSMVYDEVVLENPVLKGMPIWDMERTEVLRGPQGTLFGRNTTAGIVKFDSKKPSQEKDAFARLSWGMFNTVDFRGAIGGRLSDTFSARLSLLFQNRSDWIDNKFTGENDALGGYSTGAFRLQFLWEPNEKFSGLLNLHAWDVDGTARIFRENIMKPGTNQLVDSFAQDEVYHDGLNQQDIGAQGGVLKFDYDFGNMTLTSVTGFEALDMFSRGDIDGGFGSDNPFAPPGTPPGGPIGPIPQESETADGIPDLDQFTQEFRLANNQEDSRLGWLLGVYLFQEDLNATTNNYDSLTAGNPEAGFAWQTQDTEAWALFGSLNYELSERWWLQGGLRYSNDEKDFAAARPEPVFQTPTLRPITVNTSDDFVSWDLSTTYAINDGVNVYARAATSSRAPSIQGRILFQVDFDFGLNPETDGVSVADTESILSLEAGVKTELLDRRLRLNFTGYTWETDDQQLTIIGGASNTAVLVNADKVEGYGFEADAEFMPTPRFLATLGLSYNSTEIKDGSLTVNGCRLCTILDPVAPNGEFIIDGNSLPHAPEWIFNGILDYRLPVGEGLFFGSFDWAFYDEKQFFLYESAEFKDDSLEAGLRLGYTFNEAKYEMALYGRNIFDAEIMRGGIDFSNNTGFTNDPAIWGLEFVARF